MKNLLLKLFVLIGIFVWTTTSYGQFVTETVCTTTTVMPADGEVFTDPTDGVTGGPGGDCTTTSSGDPGDYPNSNCVTVTTLSAPPGSQISVTFTSFRVNGSFDWLSIFDGDSAVTATNGGGTATNPSSPDPELWRSTSDGDELIDMTNAGMTTFTSTNGSLTFAFRTSSVVQTCGWEATIAIIGGPGGGGGDITECGNAPEPIPATGTSGLMTPSVASVTGTGNIGTDYSIDNVTINLDHTFAADVEMVLVSPTGTRLALCTDNGGSSAFDTAVDLVFTDASANNITDLDFGDPVEADYRAEGGANAFPVGFGDGPGEDMNTVFSGESITGDWTLEINDDAGGDSGNLNSFCINLVDLTAPGPDDPIIVCPSDVMSNSDPGECGAVVNFATPGAIDPNGGTVTVTQTMGPASGSLFPIGDTIVEFTATNDEAPNETSTCQFTVTVVDNEAPTITCPADITQTNDPGVCGANITVPMP
ncbi:proprotein convertase P-domain-containing protein, partial [Marinirhabdus gelatinilytica]